MKAKHEEEVVDVWKISHEEPEEDWIKSAFANNHICWQSTMKDVLMVANSGNIFTALAPSIKGMGSFSTSMGRPGMYLVKNSENNLTVVDEKHFEKDYTPLSD